MSSRQVEVACVLERYSERREAVGEATRDDAASGSQFVYALVKVWKVGLPEPKKRCRSLRMQLCGKRVH